MVVHEVDLGTRALHAPKVRDVSLDERLVKRATRLASAANAVAAIDLKSIADTYQQEVGGSAIEATAVAAAALGAALKASLTGSVLDAGACAEAAQKEVRQAAKRQTREAKAEAVLASRNAEDSSEAFALREATRLAQEARTTKALANKEERLAGDAATRKAMRDERMFAAAGRRALSEARAKFASHHTKGSPDHGDGHTSPFSDGRDVRFLSDDPVVRRARELCHGAAQVVAQLEEQNKPSLGKASIRAERPLTITKASHRSPAPMSVEDEALIAKAKELLADYKPAQKQRRTPVNSLPASPRGVSALQRVRLQCTDISIEMNQRKLRF